MIISANKLFLISTLSLIILGACSNSTDPISSLDSEVLSSTTTTATPPTTTGGNGGQSSGVDAGKGRPDDRYACNFDSLGYCIFTGTPHQTGLDPGTEDIVDRDGNFLFSANEAVAVNAQGEALQARGTPAFDGDDLQRSSQDGLGEDEKAFQRVMAIMFPIRNVLMYDIAVVTQTEWDLLVSELEQREIKETTFTSGPTPKDNYYGRQGVFDLAKNPGGRDIHHDVMKFLEEAGLYLLCHVTTNDFGEMLQETHPEGHDPCGDAGIATKIPFPHLMSSTTAATTATTAAPTTTTLAPEPPSISDLLDASYPLNIAHAGGDQDYPHSTMYAFQQAVIEGVDMLEMDVRITADGVLVVHHDETVDGTTGVSGIVSEMNVGELQLLDNAWWWSPTCWPCRDLNGDDYPLRGVRTGDVPPPDGFASEDFRIETFFDIASAFPEMPLDIEIKDEGALASEAIAALISDIDALDRRDSVIVASFSSDVIAEFKQAAPDISTSPGTDEMVAWVLNGEPLGDHAVVQVPPFYGEVEVLVPSFFEAAETASVDVWVWMSDTSQETYNYYLELVSMGADGIINGRPEAMTRVSSGS